MTETIERKAQIIFDKPADEDAFDGGGHKRCAQALAESIKQLANRNGAIGLEGSWGAGKSTVINLAEEDLEARGKDKNEYHVFTFDLWEHQSDDFRRAFLEEFVNWLRIKNHLKAKVAEEVKDRIRNRVKTVSTSKLKEYSFFSSALLLLTPLVPILYAWMGPTAFRVEEAKKPLPFDIWDLGLAIFAAVYAAFIFKVFFGMFEVVKDENGNKISFGFWAKLKRSVSKSLSLFSKDIEKEDSKQSIRETDPTTVEFHGVFRDLLSKVQKKNKRMVFVLDNIDRLPINQVPEVWSEVRSLFSNTTFESDAHNAWVTAVIPYDKPFIKQAFEVNRKNDDAALSIESDIIGKTFSVILYVAPPVATDWRNFFMSQLDKAFTPAFEDETKFRLFRMLKYYFQKEGAHPTPRMLITFVNEIAALWMQWGGVIQAEAIALYIIHRPLIEGNPVSVQKSELVGQHYLNIAHIEDWQKDFAALSYNVDPDIAYQVLLQQPIVAALTNSGPNDLIELARSKVGFNEIFMEALDEALGDLDQKESSLVSNIAKNINALELSKELRKDVWRKMAKAASGIQYFDLGQLDSFDGVFIVAKNQEKPRISSFANTLRQRFTASVPLSQKEEEVENQNATFRHHGYYWLKAVSEIGSILEEVLGEKKQGEFYKKTQIPDHSDVCLGVAYACAETEGIGFSDLDLRTEAESIISSFTYLDLVESENSAKRLRKALHEVSHLISDNGRSKLLDIIANCMRSQDVKTAEGRSEVIKSYTELYYSSEEEGKFKPHLDGLANDGTLIWQGDKANEEGDIELISIIQWLMFVVFKDTATPSIPDKHSNFGSLGSMKDWYSQSITSTEMKDEQVKKLAELAAEHDEFTEWLTCTVNDKTGNQFYTKVFTEVLKQKKYSSLPIERCVFQYNNIQNAVGEELAKDFLGEFGRWKVHFDKHFSEDGIYKIPTEFIEDASSLSNKSDYTPIFDKIDEHLRSSGQEDWENSLQAEDHRLRLLIVRRETEDITLPVEAYRPALLSHIKTVLTGSFTPSTYASKYDEVWKALKTANRKQLASDLLKALPEISVTKEGCEKTVSLFPELVDKTPYLESADDAINYFFSKILSSEEEHVKDFMRSKANVIKKCLKKASEVSKGSFEEILESIEEAKGENVGEWLPELRNLLGLKKKKPKPANDEGDTGKEEDKA